MRNVRMFCKHRLFLFLKSCGVLENLVFVRECKPLINGVDACNAMLLWVESYSKSNI